MYVDKLTAAVHKDQIEVAVKGSDRTNTSMIPAISKGHFLRLVTPHMTIRKTWKLNQQVTRAMRDEETHINAKSMMVNTDLTDSSSWSVSGRYWNSLFDAPTHGQDESAGCYVEVESMEEVLVGLGAEYEDNGCHR